MRLVIAHMYGIAGRRSELVTLLADAERAATSDAGCLRYAATATVADPNHFVVVEEWRDDAAVEAHYASRRFERFQYALHGLLARPERGHDLLGRQRAPAVGQRRHGSTRCRLT